jgi:hypothetical protein
VTPVFETTSRVASAQIFRVPFIRNVEFRGILWYILIHDHLVKRLRVAEEKQNSSWVPTNPLYDPSKPMQVGGQAVIEGVMMRAPGSVATAVRRANGDIVVKRKNTVR